MLEEFKKIMVEEFKQVVKQLDEAALFQASGLIEKSESQNGRVHVTGIGKPSYIAGYAASLFSSIGTPAYFLDGTEAVHGSSGQVKPGDVVIAISNSGETKELLYSVQTLKQNGSKVISLSRDENTSLSRLSDVKLHVSVEKEGDDLNKPPRASILAQMIVLQALSLVLQYDKDLQMSDYIKWHPGGSIGKSVLSTTI